MPMDPERQLSDEAAEQTLNVLAFDAIIRHQVHLLRVAGSVRNEVLEILNDTEAEIRRLIQDGIGGQDDFASADRVNERVRRARRSAWAKVTSLWNERMKELASTEMQWVDGAVKTVSPVILDTKRVPLARVESLVNARPFEGRVLRQWASSVAQSDLARIQDTIRSGVAQGLPPREIARGVVGSARLRGTDGATQITRRNAEAITRSAVIHYSAQARRLWSEANRDLVERELYVATLDSRTTPICRALDGEIFEVGKGQYPPVHFNCRSARTMILSPEAVGQRPAKPSTQRQLLREYAAQNNIKAPRQRKNLPRGHKARFDQFARRRIRELTGTVPAKVTYRQWLKRQTKEFQNDVLGPTRAKLFREGGLDLDKFVDRQGKELNLKELVRVERQAFIDAGLDPGDYL